MIALVALLVSSAAAITARFPLVGCDGLLAEQFSQRYAHRQHRDLITDVPVVTVESIAAAYRNGLFPWGTDDRGRGLWYNPRERGVLLYENLRIPRKDRRYIERTLEAGELVFTENRDFNKVITACARGYRGTWLTPPYVSAFKKAFEAGLVRSNEAWSPDGEWLGGLYGVQIDGVYCGESMAHVQSNVLKVLLCQRIQASIAEGHEFMDVQEAILYGPSISLAVKWGARPIPRKAYLRLLREAQRRFHATADSPEQTAK